MSAEEATSHTDGPGGAAQVADALRARLISLEEGWRFGQRIPAERRIAQELGVSRADVAAGLRLLAAQGWLAPDDAHGLVVRRQVGPAPGSP